MYPGAKPFYFFYINIIFSEKDELKDLDDLDDIQSKVKQVRLVEKLGKRGIHYDVRELFDLITKALTDTSQKLLEETRTNTKAIGNLDE